MGHGMTVNQDRFSERAVGLIKQGLQLIVIGTPMIGDPHMRFGEADLAAHDRPPV